MTLGGLLKHMAYVESAWFSHSLHARDREAPFDTVDWRPTAWEWHSAAGDTPDQLRALWQDAVDLVPDRVAEALAGTAAWTSWPGARGQTVRRRACAGSCAT